MRTSGVRILSLAAAFAALRLFAVLEPVSPVVGERVALLTPEQKEVIALPSYDARLAALKADKAGPCRYSSASNGQWRVSAPLVFRWIATADEKGPWLVRLGRSRDLAGAKEFWIESREVQKRKVDAPSKGTEYIYTAPRPNLEIGREYFWQVWSNTKCPGWAHPSTLRAACSCGKGPKASASPVASFTTEDAAPRWIKIEGRVENMRDLGGWRTEDGRRVRQGMAYRGQGLNDNSVNGDVKGRNRLTVEDVAYLTGELGIKTDLDLRTSAEISSLGQSPLGPGVKFIARSSPFYKSIFEDKQGIFPEGPGKKVMAKNFREFCNPENYPIYFHCIGGADRTGSLAYVLNGVLGVSRHDLEVDWESTFYPELPEMCKGYSGDGFWRREQHLTDGIAKYGGPDASWRERIELYLLDCGVTKEEIERFRSIMLE